ncbi:unnamed protein product [marine sediment metagenome]|uniref:Homing endonuclease LAGLIDADG domain-containing protein n=1 Tax=marine sediment metagenome TaxID=412755 RepID=X1RVE1_9ZZZZ
MRWSPEELELLSELYPLSPRVEIERLIPKHSWMAIETRAEELKIKRATLWHFVNFVPKPVLSATMAAYVAGILDGEGSVGLSGSLKQIVPGTAIYNQSEELMQFLQRTFPFGRIHRGRGRNKVFEVTTLMGTIRFLEPLLPYLIIKRKFAELVIQFCYFRLEQMSRCFEHRAPPYSRWELEIWSEVAQKVDRKKYLLKERLKPIFPEENNG